MTTAITHNENAGTTRRNQSILKISVQTLHQQNPYDSTILQDGVVNGKARLAQFCTIDVTLDKRKKVKHNNFVQPSLFCEEDTTKKKRTSIKLRHQQ